MLNILEQLKNFDADRYSIEQLVALAAGVRTLRAEFEAQGLEVPEFVDSKLKAITREVKTRNAENLEKQLREKKARLEAFKTPQEKKAEIKKDIKKLEETLAAL